MEALASRSAKRGAPIEAEEREVMETSDCPIGSVRLEGPVVNPPKCCRARGDLTAAIRGGKGSVQDLPP